MGRRRYYRRSRSYGGRGGNPWVVLIILLSGYILRYWTVILTIAVIVAVVYLAWRIYKKRKGEDAPQEEIFNSEEIPVWETAQEPPMHQEPMQEENRRTYSSKHSIMTECERAYFDVIKETLGSHYVIQPQINLASVINKDSYSRYRNELFRNIDFGVFDQDYRLLVLIEINDESHSINDRKERDRKVKAICAEANIPLITFWTKYGINKAYIRGRLAEYLQVNEKSE